MASRLAPVATNERNSMYTDISDSQGMGSPLSQSPTSEGTLGSPLKKTATNTSAHLDSPFDDYEQDWNTTTHERDTWASRERRKSTPFGSISNTAFLASHHESKRPRSGSSTVAQPRKGSILSVWTDPEGDDEVDENLTRVMSGKSDDARRERRGSVLSLFKRGKDDNGRSVIHSEGA